MTAKGQYRSEALSAIHKTMNALYEIGAINKVTMREFDELCLEPVLELKPEEIYAPDHPATSVKPTNSKPSR